MPLTLLRSSGDGTSGATGVLRSAWPRRQRPTRRAGSAADVAAERITGHLTRAPAAVPAPEPGIADQFRALLDDHLTSGISLAWAAATLERSVPHLVRSFTRQFGVSPHAYLIGRRIDAARQLLLAGAAPAEVATAVGFCDQAHLTRHFRRHTATTPARYARSHPRAGGQPGGRTTR